MNDTKIRNYKNKFPAFITLAILSVIISIWKLGFSVNFWIILALWIIVYLVFYIKPVTKNINIIRLVVAVLFVFAMLVSFKIIMGDDSISPSPRVSEKVATFQLT